LCGSVTTQHPEGLRLTLAAGSAGANDLFWRADRLTEGAI
jgi:hypothetical protein